jgi:RimJ/RimL family protein N-acetyltransferase
MQTDHSARPCSSELLGVVGLHRPVWTTPKFEAGYWCRSTRAGNVYTREALSALVAMAFDDLAAARVVLFTDAQNAASRRLAQACGFLLEGVLRHERRDADGSLRDECVCARTAGGADFRSIRPHDTLRVA